MANASSVELIFFAALEKEDPKDRAAYLEAACAGDDELRREVERLLAAHPRARSFLEPPVAGTAATFDAPISEGPGTVIGP